MTHDQYIAFAWLWTFFHKPREIPPDVEQTPIFAKLVSNGYIAAEGDFYSITDKGRLKISR